MLKWLFKSRSKQIDILDTYLKTLDSIQEHSNRCPECMKFVKSAMQRIEDQNRIICALGAKLSELRKELGRVE